MLKYLVSLFFVFGLIFTSCDKDDDIDSLDPPIEPGTDSVNVDHDSKIVGVSTSSFSDANLTAASLQKFNPHFMRYYLGSTIVFDSTNAPNGIASVTNYEYERNGELKDHMSENMNGWKYTPALNFDEFIALCKATGAEPVILLPVYAAYASTPGPKMTKTQLYAAHAAFVKYANLTKRYGVKYWEIGNEDDLEPDNTDATTYGKVFNEIVPILKAVDPTIECGANTFYNGDRWEELLPLIKKNMGFAVIHQYSAFLSYDDFLTGDMSGQFFVEEFNLARKNLNDSSIPSKVLVTEISSLCTFAPYNERNNCLWKGLHNIQLLLQYGSYSNVLGTMNWCTWYTGGLDYTFNVFSGPDETELSPVGLTLKVLNDHLYKIVDKKTKLQSGSVELTISHNDDFSKMSVFILNKSKTAQSIPLNITGFTGNPATSTKWVYQSETVDEWSQAITYTQATSTDITDITDVTIEVEPLSCTVYDFN